jgi:hypothetical protein
MNEKGFGKLFLWFSALLRRAPGFADLLLCFLVLQTIPYLYPYTWPAPEKGITLVGKGVCTFLMIWAAYRHRLEPLYVRLCGSAAVFFLLFLGLSFLKSHLRHRLTGFDSISELFALPIALGCSLIVLWAVISGIRKQIMAVPRFIESLKDRRARVRRRAVVALAEIARLERRLKNQDTFPYLGWAIKFKFDTEPTARRALPGLLTALNDQDAIVRSEAAWAINQFDTGAEKVVTA